MIINVPQLLFLVFIIEANFRCLNSIKLWEKDMVIKGLRKFKDLKILTESLTNLVRFEISKLYLKHSKRWFK